MTRPNEVGPKNRHQPPMTAQHFQLIAEVLDGIEADRPSHKVIVASFDERLAMTNPNYKSHFFIRAANLSRGSASQDRRDRK